MTVFNVRLADGLIDQIEECAELQGQTKSQWARDQLIRAVRDQLGETQASEPSRVVSTQATVITTMKPKCIHPTIVDGSCVVCGRKG